MERDDLPTLRGMGFKDDELRELGLWQVATGKPDDLAEAYIRRSKKKDTLATLREHLREVCRKARDEGKKIRHVWFEQRSASKAHIRREEFENATSAIIEGGKSKTLYVWKTDRLSRRGMGAVDRLIDEMEPKGARIVVTSEGLDSSLPGMRMIFGILADRARQEAKDIAMRTKIGGDAHKAEGKWPGGVPPYGLEVVDGKLRRKQSEYQYARPLIAEKLLKGVVPAVIADDLNRRKIPTRKGKKWRAQTVIHLAYSPSWAGLIPDRERAVDANGVPIDKWYRRGQPLMDSAGHPISVGEGVVTFAEWQKINKLIAGRARPGTTIGDKTRGVRKAATIMTGVFKCPLCKGLMGNGGANYRCLARVNQGPSVCVGIATTRGRVDDAMETMWRNHILSLSPESTTIQTIARDWLAYEDPGKEARKQQVAAALDSALARQLKLNKEYFLGVSSGMDEETFESLRRDVGNQIDSLKAELAELGKGSDLTPLMNAEALIALWEVAGIEGRRALIAAAAKTVTITPPKCRGDRTPIEKRLVITWKDTEDVRNIDSALAAVQRSKERREAAEQSAALMA
ncbi:recombinase family protein [Streptomyces sp. NPDC059828]|uniref:recombinase family protein n=1 Tax=Streptomyces sp. NPDC059828 TaxID=3346965 RepID=UPI0036637843